jgi:hypothetical protein
MSPLAVDQIEARAQLLLVSERGECAHTASPAALTVLPSDHDDTIE